MTLGQSDTNPSVARWMLRTAFLWVLIGAGLGLVGISAIAATIEPSEGMNWKAALPSLSPLIGAGWGLAAGLIGSLFGAIFRSVRVYAWTMVTLGSGPYLPFLADFANRDTPVATAVMTVVVVLGGVVIWWVAQRNGPPTR